MFASLFFLNSEWESLQLCMDDPPRLSYLPTLRNVLIRRTTMTRLRRGLVAAGAVAAVAGLSSPAFAWGHRWHGGGWGWYGPSLTIGIPPIVIGAVPSYSYPPPPAYYAPQKVCRESYWSIDAYNRVAPGFRGVVGTNRTSETSVKGA
jgi:hypothetical protein